MYWLNLESLAFDSCYSSLCLGTALAYVRSGTASRERTKNSAWFSKKTNPFSRNIMVDCALVKSNRKPARLRHFSAGPHLWLDPATPVVLASPPLSVPFAGEGDRFRCWRRGVSPRWRLIASAICGTMRPIVRHEVR